MTRKIIEDVGDERVIELLDDTDATKYTVHISIPDNEMRIRFHNEKGVLAERVMNGAEAYEFASCILRAYDKLEGI